MVFNSLVHHRKSIRLKEYDYSQPGEYFVTICTYDRKCFLGEGIEEKIKLSPIGEIVENCWKEIPKHFSKVNLDEYVIMPNHVHVIIVITEGRDLINQIPTKNFPLMKNPKLTIKHLPQNVFTILDTQIFDGNLYFMIGLFATIKN
ncbi:MAG: hypothetical protein NTX44_15100 [Ignavibacteriales bacterium]|nr:hypothetical protein [Ignavibacteriales bacterium]